MFSVLCFNLTFSVAACNSASRLQLFKCNDLRDQTFLHLHMHVTTCLEQVLSRVGPDTMLQALELLESGDESVCCSVIHLLLQHSHVTYYLFPYKIEIDSHANISIKI